MRAVTYHPISDPYHCAYRILSLMGSAIDQEYELEKFRILDFYCLFPSLLLSIRKTNEVRDALKEIDKSYLRVPYQILPDTRTLFRQVEGVHKAATAHLASRGILNMDAFKAGAIKITDAANQIAIAKQTFNNNPMKDFVSVVSKEVNAISLHGVNGLKARTGLLEFRYDNI